MKVVFPHHKFSWVSWWC